MAWPPKGWKPAEPGPSPDDARGQNSYNPDVPVYNASDPNKQVGSEKLLGDRDSSTVA